MIIRQQAGLNLCVELKEAKDELAAPHTQSTVDEATEHLNAAIKALVKAETKEETKTDVTKLNAVIEKAEALKQSDYTAESWKIYRLRSMLQRNLQMQQQNRL